jgi:hypothetical protein
MLRLNPPDPSAVIGARAIPVTINSPGTPMGEDGLTRGRGEIENEAADDAANPEGVDSGGNETPDSIDFLQLIREAELQAEQYAVQINRKAWSQSLRAFHNEHTIGSKYTRPEWRGRSRLFVPKTRAAVRKDNAAVAASLFNTIDAINCLPGDDGDQMQRASAAVMQQLVNYRTDRTSGKAAFPWFLVAMGARQNAVLTGVCLSKQSWKQEFRKVEEQQYDGTDDESGAQTQKVRQRWKLITDRPDMQLIPSENFVIDPGAEWTNPAQSAAYLLIKWPMQIGEVRDKMDAPVNPWNEVEDSVLQTAVENVSMDSAAVRRAREFGLDRFDETSTGTTFKIVWVYECYMRVDGEDYTFLSIGDKAYLTDPRPVADVYPEQDGERPLALGYGSLEAHRIYPMAPAESWQPLQTETNDLRNLLLDATRQNVMPISKVKRGRQIDMDQVKRRSSGSSIIVTDKDDVVWETPPQIPQSAVEMTRELDLEMDDLAGQQNYGSVETNNALGKTLGGLKLAAGAANAVQEFDIRLWIETWATPALAQIVNLEQYYESDITVLGLCAQRAQLFQKHGINQLTDQLLDQQVTVRVSVGLGAGDPQQRLAKFQSAAQVVAPLLAQTKEFQSGQVELDWEEVCNEVFGAAGYRDGGKRFFKDNGQPSQNPMQDLQTAALKAKIEKDKQQGKAAMFGGLAQLAKAALGKRELEANVVDMLLGHQQDANSMGFEHGHRHNDQILSARDHGHRHGMDITKHRQSLANDARNAAAEQMGADEDSGDAGMEGAPSGAPSGAGPQAQPPASPPTAPQQGAPAQPDQGERMLMALLQSGKIKLSDIVDIANQAQQGSK